MRACDRPGWFWLDGEPLLHDTAALSGGEQRVLSIVGALVPGLALSDLASILGGLDRRSLELVLAAFAHAAGVARAQRRRPVRWPVAVPAPRASRRLANGPGAGRIMSVVGTAIVLGLLVALMLKMRIARASVVIVSVLFGLVLGATPIGDGVNQALTALGHWVWAQLVAL